MKEEFDMREFQKLLETVDMTLYGDRLEFKSKMGNYYPSSEELNLISVIKKHSIAVKGYLQDPYDTNLEVVGVDIETTSLRFTEGKIRLISVYSDTLQLVTEKVDEVKEILVNPNIIKVFHNATFDVPYLKYHGYEVINYTDTQLMYQIIQNSPKLVKLSDLVLQYLGIYLDKGYQSDDNWQGDLTNAHFDYCLKDAEVTYQLYSILLAQIIESYLYSTYQRELAALPAVVEMMLVGIKFDWENWSSYLLELKSELEVDEEDLKCKLKCFNLRSTDALLKSLNKIGVPVSSTSEKELSNYTGEFDIIKDLLAYKKRKKIISAYGEKFNSYLTAKSYVHSNFKLIGTATSRMSSSKPNLQSIPHCMKPYFNPGPGNVFVIADYSAIELRILAEIANVPKLIDAFLKGLDPHEETAKVVFQNCSNITPLQRKVGKEINFGLIYGLTPYGLANKINENLEVKITEQEAKQFQERYMKGYPEIAKYQEKVTQSTQIMTLGGRYWLSHNGLEKLSRNQRLNYAIQATCAEGLKEALALIMAQKKSNWKIVNAIHDEIILVVDENEAQQAKGFLEDKMIEGMRKLTKIVPIAVESKIIKNWEK